MVRFQYGGLVWLLLATCATVLWAEENVRTGEVAFQPAEGEANLPELFRLEASRFAFQEHPVETSSKSFSISSVTFPSPVVTPEENNNTVHCEYFRPVGPGKHPGVIVLHILGGDFPLARLFSRSLAQHGAAALFVKMPYYGPRRQPDSPARMVSLDPEETVRGMRQAVLDVRRAAAWLGAQDEVDAEQLGIMGISLGGITSAVGHGRTPAQEPLPDPGRWRHRPGGLGSPRAAQIPRRLARQRRQQRDARRAAGQSRSGDLCGQRARAANPDAQRPARRGHSAGLHRVALASAWASPRSSGGTQAIIRPRVPVRRLVEGDPFLLRSGGGQAELVRPLCGAGRCPDRRGNAPVPRNPGSEWRSNCGPLTRGPGPAAVACPIRGSRRTSSFRGKPSSRSWR